MNRLKWSFEGEEHIPVPDKVRDTLCNGDRRANNGNVLKGDAHEMLRSVVLVVPLEEPPLLPRLRGH